MCEQLGIAEFVIVGDRGMLSHKAIDILSCAHGNCVILLVHCPVLAAAGSRADCLRSAGIERAAPG